MKEIHGKDAWNSRPAKPALWFISTLKVRPSGLCVFLKRISTEFSTDCQSFTITRFKNLGSKTQDIQEKRVVPFFQVIKNGHESSWEFSGTFAITIRAKQHYILIVCPGFAIKARVASVKSWCLRINLKLKVRPSGLCVFLKRFSTELWRIRVHRS